MELDYNYLIRLCFGLLSAVYGINLLQDERDRHNELDVLDYVVYLDIPSLAIVCTLCWLTEVIVKELLWISLSAKVAISEMVISSHSHQ